MPIEDLKKSNINVLIIGAGISGIGMAVYLRKLQPKKKFLIVEGRENIGGTWDLFKYPGIRSDSDLFTFGYDFKPWQKGKSFASAKEILEYLTDVVEEYNLKQNIAFGQKVISANWITAEKKMGGGSS